MKNGFTLLEVIIAISVITIGILGLYALIPKVISISSANIDRFIASQLAREGIEIVRNIRDTNWLEGVGVSWNDGLTDCSTGCEADYNDESLVTYQDRYLYINGIDGFYKYISSPSPADKRTKFKREIIIIPDTDVLNIKVEITWSGRGSPLEVKEKLYNWR